MRVLIVDDDPDVVALVTTILLSLGHEVRGADSRIGALSVILANHGFAPIDVIFWDMRLAAGASPVVDLADVARRVAREGTIVIPWSSSPEDWPGEDVVPKLPGAIEVRIALAVIRRCRPR